MLRLASDRVLGVQNGGASTFWFLLFGSYMSRGIPEVFRVQAFAPPICGNFSALGHPRLLRLDTPAPRQ